ncbi:hypothetical protein GCM10009743_30090 [Kribbella swartbergensis]
MQEARPIPLSCRHYRWRDWDAGERAAPEEGGLELGELEDSERLTALAEQGFNWDLRHFRIAFDEHGMYDVICRRVRIEYEPRRPTTRADSATPQRPVGYYASVFSCPFDDRVLLLAVNAVEPRLVLECMACGRVYEVPGRPRPRSSPAAERHTPQPASPPDEPQWLESVPPIG